MTKATGTPGRTAPAKKARAGSPAAKRPAAKKPAAKSPKRLKNWREAFLAALAETSNVTAACAAGRINSGKVYKLRREEAEFARQWRDALFEGYENLEMEVLGHLRAGELRGESKRKYDVANALRVLAAHRETIARERARRDHRDERQVLESIDKMIDDMRTRAAANAALLADEGAADADLA